MTLSDLLGRPDRWARLLGWALALGLLLGIIGPFGSYPANMFTRTVYWTGLFVGGTLLLWPCVAAAAVIGPARGFPLPFAFVVIALAGAVPVAALAAAGGHLFWPVRASGMRALEWYGQTVVIALPVAAGALWLETRLYGGERPLPPIAESPPSADVTHRLPDHLLESALCLQMEDHHVRIHAHQRSWLQLATLREAIDQIGPERGLQVHRSWWVARDAVRDVVEDGRSVRLKLANGLEVPVARNRIADLRTRGWLDGRQEIAG
ncbi:LytTR family DNA-binding domain-containing protein [Sphingomonas sp. BIUV-7]|uniref:LytTR family DNA-binding domain-containing protein n=1 Tax=Sphingomonas natans TaxID=3063330 RepID=A0ABT8Y8V5_9SPHN|nr:LytTR family DNA-binding domain-containing protein [Sphingomonas sp. BIUV-7]MDO6414754.1 LytTR family DNA-binding domain-containing protein [Sphingomonas sp. BIUV-7]